MPALHSSEGLPWLEDYSSKLITWLLIKGHGSDPLLLWLGHRPEATAPIRPLAWEPPYAMSAVLEKIKTQKFF